MAAPPPLLVATAAGLVEVARAAADRDGWASTWDQCHGRAAPLDAALRADAVLMAASCGTPVPSGPVAGWFVDTDAPDAATLFAAAYTGPPRRPRARPDPPLG